MATRKRAKGKQVADYRHEDATRVNNPPAGLAWQDTEKPAKRRFEYDPHLDPQLVWAGKAERLDDRIVVQVEDGCAQSAKGAGSDVGSSCVPHSLNVQTIASRTWS